MRKLYKQDIVEILYGATLLALAAVARCALGWICSSVWRMTARTLSWICWSCLR